MKSVLISIQPKWCELIARGEKTIEVRKTAPKLQTPFKCYIYCTLTGSQEMAKDLSKWRREKWWQKKGRVIGEFVCDRIDSIFNVATTDWNLLCGSTHEYHKKLVSQACLTEQEVHEYAKGRNTIYCWHISDLKIYDKPRELGEFKSRQRRLSGYKTLRIAPQSWCYVEEL